MGGEGGSKGRDPQKGHHPGLKRMTSGLRLVVSRGTMLQGEPQPECMCVCVCVCVSAPKPVCTQVCVLPSVLKDISGTLRA